MSMCRCGHLLGMHANDAVCIEEGEGNRIFCPCNAYIPAPIIMIQFVKGGTMAALEAFTPTWQAVWEEVQASG